MCACGHSADAGAVVVRGSLRPLRLGSGPFGSGPLARDGWQPSPALGHTPRLPREPRVSTRRALVLDHQHLVRPPLGEELGEKVSGSLDNAVSSRRPWVVAQRSHRRARAPVQPEESRCLRDQLRQRGCRLQGTISRMSAIVESLRYDDNKWALRLVGRDRCRCHARWAAGVSHGERTGGRHMGHGGHHGIRAGCAFPSCGSAAARSFVRQEGEKEPKKCVTVLGQLTRTPVTFTAGYASAVESSAGTRQPCWASRRRRPSRV